MGPQTADRRPQTTDRGARRTDSWSERASLAFQVPSSGSDLEFGICLGFGVWNLEFQQTAVCGLWSGGQLVSLLPNCLLTLKKSLFLVHKVQNTPAQKEK